MTPKVSIIMPSLNVAEYIEECILSALNQTMEEIEIICIDAGSTDGTCEIIQKTIQNSKKNIDVKLLHSKIKSYGYQVNIGIREAKGDYVSILETDDYIDAAMYQTLYNLAVKYDVNMVKADYDRFKTLKNGEKIYQRVMLWPDGKGYYNQVICPQKNVYLYANDYNIWKGIYNRRFLIDNQIWLNESPGAAYQDIGFAEQALSCAGQVYYTDASFYRYRMDRETSSVNSVHGLKYSYQEFKRIIDTPDIYEKIASREGLYYHMAQSFFCEYQKTLRAVNYDPASEHLRTYYEWFRKILTKCIEENSLPVENMNTYFVSQIKQLLSDDMEFCRKRKDQDFQTERWEKELLERAAGQSIYIFGAGQRGKHLIDILWQNDMVPMAVCDNDENLWGHSINGIDVLSPSECVNDAANRDGLFVIANKFYGKEIFHQLSEMGVLENRIVFLNSW